MNKTKTSLLIIITMSYSCWGMSQMSSSASLPSNASSTIELDQFQPPPNYTTAQIIPGYKIALKKGMFEVMSGLGHIDESQESSRGQAQNVKQSPQTDFIPFQVAYGFTDNFNISIAGKAMKQNERVTNASYEGTSEPQFSASYAFRNSYSALLISGTYTANIGAKEIRYKGISRTEGNTLNGGASSEVNTGYFARLGPTVLGGEISYLYKDSRIVNSDEIELYTATPTAQQQYRQEGGAEKTIRAIAELALSFRLGLFAGRTWVEPEERIISNQLSSVTFNSYYKDFIGAYGRIQVHPRLSVLPLLSVTEAPDTSGQTSHSNHEVLTQVNLRFRF